MVMKPVILAFHRSAARQLAVLGGVTRYFALE
jgi:hypothetical protein